MPIDLYKGFTNNITGETFRCISYTPYAFRFDWIVEPKGFVPFEHIHVKQTEIFRVKRGELRIVIDGEDHIVKEGQSIVVPEGKKHQAYNNLSSKLHCVVEYIPGLDNYKFFQCFGGLVIDENISRNGTINIPRMLYFTRKMKAKCVVRTTNIPAPLFYLGMYLFYIVGSVLGWEKLYKDYTG